MCLSGDHQSCGNHPGAKNVHDIDSMQFLRMMKEMRDENKFQCGEEIPGGGPRFLIGGAANPFADPAEWRPYRLAKKAIAGADFVQTQLVYDMERFREYMKRVVGHGRGRTAQDHRRGRPVKKVPAWQNSCAIEFRV